MQKKLLQIKDLSVKYFTSGVTVKAVNGIDLELNNGET